MTPEPTMDLAFKALADPSRRRMLDLLRAQPGLTVSALTEHFEVSRFAVMKHLRVLEAASLVISRRQGRTRRLYLNAVPIQTIYDRWTSQFSAIWASSLTSLKYNLERGEDSMTTDTTEQLYVVYIRTTADALWRALTEPELTRQYFHGTDFRSSLRLGESIEYVLTRDGESRVAVRGEILVIEPPQRLSYTFRFASNDDPPTEVHYEIEPVGEMVKLTVRHVGFPGENATYRDTQEGWPPILSGLKTLLETGTPLVFPEED
jgi:uncharacterized protein YndB with AHSA1/START domain/predicted transcriptional regulator